MSIKYRCLILDHDDTAVDSTPEIHYPSFVESLNVLRPDMKPISLEEFILYNFSPGFSRFCDDVLQLSKDEKEYQYKTWWQYTDERVPSFYPGFVELLKEYKALGGIITVVSHSESSRIKRDYETHCDFCPDLIFGWELEETQRKPNPYPVLEIMKRFGLMETEVLVVDDLKPGLEMAKACNVEFAGVGWSHRIHEIECFMTANANYYFSSIDMFREFILSR